MARAVASVQTDRAGDRRLTHPRATWAAVAGAAIVLSGTGFAYSQLPSWAADALLHPPRRPVDRRVGDQFEEVDLAGAGVRLSGWRARATGARRGALVCLHGIGDNRMSAAGIAAGFTRRGLDVIAYDSRAQGESGGDACTYGYYEKQDLRRVLGTIDPGPIIVMGSSLGAAVALQAAADDTRISALVVAEIFADLRTVARERAPFFLTGGAIRQAFLLAEQRGAFQVDAVSPVRAAAHVAIPVLVIHGAADHETPPDHSQRVFDALRGPKRFILVPGAGHNQSLGGPIWHDVEEWVDRWLAPAR